MELEKLDGEFTVCKVASFRDIDCDTDFCFTARTDHEISLVCPTDRVPAYTAAREDGWRGIRVKGPLDFALTGILAGLSGVLAGHEIAVFAVSTFDTDYLFVKKESFEKTVAVLMEAGYTFL